ncbi:MAG TPA: HAD family hydrolase [Nocardioidaceae bacterium]|nr:HAD family hydrolase [Nocardioidaceae bacterium]
MSESSTTGRAGVLFDVDGTLLDTNYLHVLAWWQAFRDTGHDGVTMAAIHRAIGIASEGLVEHLLGKPDHNAVEAHSERYAALREHVVPFPRTADLVQACAAAGLVVVLATSGKEADLEWMRPAIGAQDSVDGATTASDVEQAKPAPDLLSVAMEQHRLSAERTVVVGDTVWDVESAERAGLPCIALTCGGISRSELLAAGAVEVYDDPVDLLESFAGSRLARFSRQAG